MPPKRLSMMIALLPALAGFQAQAESLDPKQIRIITPTSATSDCIDKPKSPICAVETFLACTRRIDKAMCARIGLTDFHYPDKPEDEFRYRILSVKEVGKKDVPKWEWEKPDGLRPGDVEVVIQEPDLRLPACPRTGCKFTYILKTDGSIWRVVDWYGWGAD